MKKTVSRLALAAGASVLATSAMAADLGGNCCADLEERIAELEATTARKGNRVVSLEVSGHVHQGIMFWDDGYSETNAYIGTPNTSRSRFRFKGKATISAEWEAGFLIEIGLRQRHLASMSQNDPDTTTSAGLDIRHEALYLRSKRLGTVWFGWTGEATEGITEINLGGTLNNSPDFILAGPGDILLRDVAAGTGPGARTANLDLGNAVGVAGEQAGEGNRTNNIKYVSPTVMGFVASASWGEDDSWGVALRFANEFNGIRVAAGAGYRNSVDACAGVGGDDDDATFPANDPTRCAGFNDVEQFGTSASVLHTPTGLYVAAQYGYNEASDSGTAFRGGQVQGGSDENWYVTAGLKRKFHAIGATNVYAKYGEYDRGIGGVFTDAIDTDREIASGDVEAYGLGINQKIDSAAMEIYVVWNHIDAEVRDTDGFDYNADVDSVTVGSRIKF